jgi:peptidoglycan hydrolase CwlO-like protein
MSRRPILRGGKLWAQSSVSDTKRILSVIDDIKKSSKEIEKGIDVLLKELWAEKDSRKRQSLKYDIEQLKDDVEVCENQIENLKRQLVKLPED